MLHTEGSGNSFVDSVASKAVTANGDVTQTTAQYKLGGKSTVFDGSGDYLSLPNSNDFDFGSGNFTIDFWIYINGSQANDVGIINFGNNQGDPSDTNWVIYFQNTTVIRFLTGGRIVGSSIDWDVNIDFTGITTGTWLHLAVVRTGNDYKTFTNGVLGNTVTNSSAIQDINSPLEIGRWVRTAHTEYFNGYLDELRISKGIARWTSNFTPPSSPYGKVYTVTGTKKFGDASGEFKGSGEYLSLADSDDWNFGSGDFTIDVQFRLNSIAVGASQILVSQTGLSGLNDYFYLYINRDAGGTVYSLYFWAISGGGVVVRFSGEMTGFATGTWSHAAIVRSGNNFNIYFNGTSITNGTSSSSMPNSDGLLVSGGYIYNGTPQDLFNGYIDEVRISKGIARWTSNFTPPTAPYDVDTTPPTVSSTSPAGSSTGVGVSSAISATFSEDINSSTITTSTFTLSSSSGSSVSGTVSYSNKVATFTPSSNLSYSTTYTATIFTGVKDISGNAMSSNYTLSFTTGSAPDVTAPSNASVSINSGASYTNSTAVTLTLSATDSVGVVGYYTSTSSSTPVASASGWNSVTSATSYTGSVSYSLTSGDEQKTVYVWFKDAAGNVSSSASDSITLDTTAPIVTITSPTSNDTYTATSSALTLEGSASDSTSGVKEVTWSNDKGGSGTASGTTYWSISSISLTSGDNKITVTAKDNAGNTLTDTITVTYSAATKPTVTTGSATNVTATSATVTGTVNANGLSTTAWFEYGTVKGTYGSKSSTQTVTGSNDTTVSATITGLTAETTYYYRIAAQNNSGTSYGSEMTFIYSSKGSAPTVTTESATDVTTTTATLNGTVNANGISTTAWFEYGSISGSYGSKSNTKAVTGSTDTTVSASISGLTAGTTYYYRIAAQNSIGTSYGKEMSFYYTSQTEPPSVTTEAATDVTATSATLNGEVNPNSQSTTVWFEYGVLSGTYKYKTDTQSLSGSSYTKVSAAVTGLTAGTTYYYRIVAKNSVGTSYGTEMEFYKSPGTDTTPTPTITVTPTLPPLPQPSPTATPVGSSGSISGDVKDGDGNVLQGVTVTIVGANGRSPLQESAETDARGKYEFTELAKGNYTLTYEKDGYQSLTKNVSLGEAEAKDLGTTILEEEGALGGIYGNVVDIKGDPIESVQIKLKGVKTKVTRTESSDADGYYEFTGLDADTYIITAKKKRYRKFKQTVKLEEGEEKEVEIEMRKTTKKVKALVKKGNKILFKGNDHD